MSNKHSYGPFQRWISFHIKSTLPKKILSLLINLIGKSKCETMAGNLVTDKEYVSITNIKKGFLYKMDLAVRTEYRGKGIGKKLVQLCLQKLPHGDWYAHSSANNFNFYEKCGFEVKDLSQNGTCAYYGYIQARKDGHR